MRISFPTGVWPPDIDNAVGYEDGAPNAGTNRSIALTSAGKIGATVDFFGVVMKDFGVNLFEVVPTTKPSTEFASSTFTQCCHEVRGPHVRCCDLQRAPSAICEQARSSHARRLVVASPSRARMHACTTTSSPGDPS